MLLKQETLEEIKSFFDLKFDQTEKMLEVMGDEISDRMIDNTVMGFCIAL